MSCELLQAEEAAAEEEAAADEGVVEERGVSGWQDTSSHTSSGQYGSRDTTATLGIGRKEELLVVAVVRIVFRCGLSVGRRVRSLSLTPTAHPQNMVQMPRW